MKKDLNIRVSRESYKELSKLAKNEGRTIKGMIQQVISEYVNNRIAYEAKI